MSTFLFNQYIFGPIVSRRLGKSLGINLLPLNTKVCNFNCIYCECGWNSSFRADKAILPKVEEIKTALQQQLQRLSKTNKKLDTITFAGNGEPTMHPNFKEIMQQVLLLRDCYYPQCKVSVLTNGSLLKNKLVAEALQMVDQCIVKLDAGNQNLFQLINQPAPSLQYENLLKAMARFKGEMIVQSIFFKGTYSGQVVNNYGSEATEEWIRKLQGLNISKVLIYTISRDTPAEGLMPLTAKEMEPIAKQLIQKGFKAEVYV